MVGVCLAWEGTAKWILIFDPHLLFTSLSELCGSEYVFVVLKYV